MRTWLVLDCHYLCHRALHTSGSLSWKNQATGIIFGFLKSISVLKDEFQTDSVAFCFEHRHLFRRDLFPDYKRKRKTREKSEEEQKLYESFGIQVCELRKRYLPGIGFKNIFSYRGMESDDVMASIAKNLPAGDSAVLVTSDYDMLQCLSESVSMYSPQKRKLFTESWFRKTYKLPPHKWAVVKAIAGCSGDGVPGIRGVGEVTALKYLRGELPQDSNAVRAILSKDGKATIRRNRELVELPFKGCPVPELKGDCVTRKSWLSVCEALGMKSIASRPPILTWRLLQ